MSVADAIDRAWYGSSRWIKLLTPLESLFRAVTALRRGLYRVRILSSYKATVPVVVVGNITVGGTGKTPVVMALVEALKEAGLRPGVVSRGYGAQKGQFPRIVDASSTATEVGDEPLLIHQRTAVPCVVDPKRARAVRTLTEAFEVDVVISDDGLQHYALRRDFEIALLDARRRIGNGRCLPVGPLREPAERMLDVDWVVYRGGVRERDGAVYEPIALVDVASDTSTLFVPTTGLRQVNAVAGIGQPAQFFHSLREAGFEVTEHVFPDHHSYTRAELDALADAPIIMTEKDAVKCRPLLTEADDGKVWYLMIEALLPDALVNDVIRLVQPT